MLMERLKTLTIAVYFVVTGVLLAMTIGSLLLIDPDERLRFVSALSPWIPGLLWLLSAVAVTMIAYRYRAVALAVAAAMAFLVTSVALYVWANAVAFPGGGAWDQLRAITGGGLFPILAVLLFVAGGAVVTLTRGTGSRRHPAT